MNELTRVLIGFAALGAWLGIVYWLSRVNSKPTRDLIAKIRARGTVRARLVDGTWFVNGDDYQWVTGFVLGTVEERPDGCSCGEQISSATVDGSILEPCACSEHPA